MSILSLQALVTVFTDKLFLNNSKTKLAILKSRKKTITKHLNFRISGQPRGYTARRFTLANTFGKPKEETKSQYWSTFQDQALCTYASFANIILFII